MPRSAAAMMAGMAGAAAATSGVIAGYVGHVRIGTVISTISALLRLLMRLIGGVLTTGVSRVVASSGRLAGMPRPVAAGAVRVGRGIASGAVMIGMTSRSVLVAMMVRM